jgi:hypothetical protein
MDQHTVFSWFFYVFESIFIGTCHTLCQCDFTPTTTMLLLKVCFKFGKYYSCRVEMCLMASLSLTLPCWPITFWLLYSFLTFYFVGIIVDGSQALHNIFFPLILCCCHEEVPITKSGLCRYDYHDMTKKFNNFFNCWKMSQP